MQSASSRHAHRPAVACSPKKNTPGARPARRSPSVSSALFYLALWIVEAFLLGSALWSATGTWPAWSIVSIVFANMFFALSAGHHPSGKVSKPIAPDVLLAAASMLILVVLTIHVTDSASGPAVLIYAWLCALLVNILRYYPARPWQTKRQR
jgi:Na+-translocating ferredoxin:NAD+ oxidoreductase RnfD subunit